jgi:hypothetical protein
MLPPYGLYLIEKLSHTRSFYQVFFGAALLFGLFFFITPTIIPETKECNCFAKYDFSSLVGVEHTIFTAWGLFYFISLAYSVVLIVWDIVHKHGDMPNLKLLLIGYITFFPISFIFSL